MNLVIYAGREFSSDFTVVSDDGTTPEVLDPTDTATMTIQTSGSVVECVIPNVDMTIVDADNGLFNLVLTPEQTGLLKQTIGAEEDRYPAIGGYEGFIDFTLASGNRQAMVTIGVKEVAACPVQP